MSVLGHVPEQPKLSINDGPMATIVSDKTIDRISRFEAEMQVDKIDDLIGMVATDLSRHVGAPKLH